MDIVCWPPRTSYIPGRARIPRAAAHCVCGETRAYRKKKSHNAPQIRTRPTKTCVKKYTSLLCETHGIAASVYVYRRDCSARASNTIYIPKIRCRFFLLFASVIYRYWKRTRENRRAVRIGVNDFGLINIYIGYDDTKTDL